MNVSSSYPAPTRIKIPRGYDEWNKLHGLQAMKETNPVGLLGRADRLADCRLK